MDGLRPCVTCRELAFFEVAKKRRAVTGELGAMAARAWRQRMVPALFMFAAV